MTQVKEEAAAIARLLGRDGARAVGWVYLWNTAELSILWIEQRDTANFIEPSICSETLAKAKHVTPVDVIDLLEELSTSAPDISE
ncbi:hypothetical protein AB9K34_10745 [Sedimentitalea sp. XS_ASV28]|uniref:hypothetical protein n=1 Tax=Sedimentitalea sp. XS_ASV28 TaxID=3241296 RepID=UPI0035190836